MRQAAGPLAYPSPARGPPRVQHHISTPLPPRRNPARAGATPLRPASDSRGGFSRWCKQILEATEESGPAGAGIRGYHRQYPPHLPALGGHTTWCFLEEGLAGRPRPWLLSGDPGLPHHRLPPPSPGIALSIRAHRSPPGLSLRFRINGAGEGLSGGRPQREGGGVPPRTPPPPPQVSWLP